MQMKQEWKPLYCGHFCNIPIIQYLLHIKILKERPVFSLTDNLLVDYILHSEIIKCSFIGKEINKL